VAGPVCGVVAESRAESVCGAASFVKTYLRCTVQGVTALLRAANNGEEAQLKQLIGVKANLHAKDVIYRCCARVSLSECSEFPAPDITLKILCMLKFLVLIILHELSLCDQVYLACNNLLLDHPLSPTLLPSHMCSALVACMFVCVKIPE
jgi:hypothetical protein